MAELHKVTKNGRIILEPLNFLGVGQNLQNAKPPTDRRMRVEFENKNGTKLSFRLEKEEINFIMTEFVKHELDLEE